MKRTTDYFVAAIDLGTTFSNFAYALLEEQKDKPLRIFSRVGWDGGVVISQAAPTVILFDQDGEFHSFGAQAEKKYSELAIQGAHHGWRYFRRFKMDLDAENINQGLKLQDDQGKTMAAMDVFVASIKYLKDETMNNLLKKIEMLEESDIRWVLTIPAMWDSPVKRFMIEAAEHAGIRKEKLVLAYEPAVAALYSKERELAETLDERKRQRLKGNLAGLRFMIIDLGGGTVDVMTFKVQKNGDLKSLEEPCGGPWGGILVDKAFNNIMSRVFGEDVFTKWQQNATAESLELDQTVEQKKKTIRTGSENVRIKISHHLWEAFEQSRSRKFTEASVDGYSVKREHDKLKISTGLAVSIFNESIESTMSHIQDKLLRLNKKKKVDTIVLTGGFSESTIVQEAFRSRFPKYEVVSTLDAELAVVMGTKRKGCAIL